MEKSTEDILEEHFSFPIGTLKELSTDTAHGKYLTDSDITAVDFDELKRVFCEKKGMSRHLSSNDALYISDKDWYFIEFKNGKIEDSASDTHASIEELREKMDQSFHILFSPDYIDLQTYFPNFRNDISFSLQNVNYILVYNDEKNKKLTAADKKSQERQVKQGIYAAELEFFEKNYDKVLRKREISRCEKLGVEGFVKKRIQEECFLILITDIRKAMDDSQYGAFDDFLDDMSMEANLPIMRFGLEEFENKLFKNVYTYTGDVFDELGKVVERGQFYRFFVKDIMEYERKKRSM